MTPRRMLECSCLLLLAASSFQACGVAEQRAPAARAERVGEANSALTLAPQAVLSVVAGSGVETTFPAACNGGACVAAEGSCTGTLGTPIHHTADTLSDPVLSWEGNSNADSCSADGLTQTGFSGMGSKDLSPTDDSGAVGPRNFVQVTNFGMTVWTLGNPPTLAAGPTFTTSLFNSLPQCQLSWTDAQVVYDRYADRWVVMRLSNNNNAAYLCFAVSEAGSPSNPAGNYRLYAFQTNASSALFADSPRIGVWSNGYYLTWNPGVIGNGNGVNVAAIDRTTMLNDTGQCAAGGTCPQMVQFLVPDPPPRIAGQTIRTEMLPAWSDGNLAPPGGAPGLIMQVQDYNMGFGGTSSASSRLQMYELGVNWAAPGNASLYTTTSVATSCGTAGTPGCLTGPGFNTGICLNSSGVADPTSGGFPNQNCMPMPNVFSFSGASFDADIAGGLYNRLVYRNWGTYESLVVAQGNAATDNAFNSPHSILNWYELRRPVATLDLPNRSAWADTQQGQIFNTNPSATSADSYNRWQASIEMDNQGDIVVGYLVGNGSTPPSIRYAGRRALDPSNTMPEGERSLAESIGTNLCGSSTPNCQQPVADFSEMALSPVDGCVFFSTNTYFPEITTTNNWHTRVGSFSFNTCSPYVVSRNPRVPITFHPFLPLTICAAFPALCRP
ncbi:MAG: hypothetical protein ACRENE_09585, partial [Polyangiaceae bacterium]